MSNSTFLTRVTLKNYKSIARCRVDLGPLMFLVGQNGAGKSNFLDALRFVSDSLTTSLDHAIRSRNGINEVRRRSGGHPTHFSIRLEFKLPDGVSGHYEFRIGSRPQGGFEVQSEECQVNLVDLSRGPAYFRVVNGEAVTSENIAPVAVKDRLYLVTMSSLLPFRPVFDALSRMAFYNLNPARIRDLQTPDAGELLSRDGDNIASVLDAITRQTPRAKERIEAYLALVVPGVSSVNAEVLGPKETLEFRQDVSGSEHPWRFPASSMSDGTLRALGVLVALFQTGNGGASPAPLVGIEEPETALHPAAVGVLLDSLEEASESRQILVASHSADLLDSRSIMPEMLLAVVAHRGVTQIAPIDGASREVVKKHLYSVGELLRLNQIAPDPEELQKQGIKQMDFTEDMAA